MPQQQEQTDAERYETATERLNDVLSEVEKVIVGQDDVLQQLLIAILCNGNVLLESNPGMGKTKMVRTLSSVLGLSFSRIQNTPDLMPSDIIGTHIIQEGGDSKEFVFQRGPIFANMILADEINRATPKTQSALLEAMQEYQVTVGNDVYDLDKPFFVMATQNPLEQEGTYPLPEAQEDRFLMKVPVTYPGPEEEQVIVDRFAGHLDYRPELQQVLSKGSILRLQEFTRQVPIADDIRDQAIRIVQATRSHDQLRYGASPRAAIHLVVAAKGHALLTGRHYVSGDDVAAMARPVLRHRIGLGFEADRAGKTTDDIIADIVDQV